MKEGGELFSEQIMDEPIPAGLANDVEGRC